MLIQRRKFLIHLLYPTPCLTIGKTLYFFGRCLAPPESHFGYDSSSSWQNQAIAPQATPLFQLPRTGHLWTIDSPDVWLWRVPIQAYLKTQPPLAQPADIWIWCNLFSTICSIPTCRLSTSCHCQFPFIIINFCHLLPFDVKTKVGELSYPMKFDYYNSLRWNYGMLTNHLLISSLNGAFFLIA